MMYYYKLKLKKNFSNEIIMWWAIILCTVIGFMAAEKATFNNYKVLRITPTTKEHVKSLRQLAENSDGFTFWKEPTFVNTTSDVMVAPHKLPTFYEIMARIKVPYQVYIENVQTLVDQTTPGNHVANQTFDFKNYHTLETIYKNLDDLAKQYPDKIQTIEGGRTYEGRQIKGVKLSFKANNPGIFIEGGNHAREWISSATVMYILHQLLTSNDPEIRALAESHNWYIFPVFNPDGYVYTFTKDRMWRKTRTPYSLSCRGSDPNRNWGYKWNTGGSSNFPCDETYAGSAPFSDVETKTMSEYIQTISDKFYAYISFHSYSQLLMFPWGYTENHIEDYKDLYAISTKAITALKKRYGTEYQTGNIAETIYIASGSTVDYVRGFYNTPLSYAFELRDTGRYGFLLPSDQIVPTGEETVDSLIAMFKEAKALGYLKI